MKKRNPNIDICEGEMTPKNSKVQGECFDTFKPIMNMMRYSQLIKSVKYKIEIEYYPEERSVIE